MTAYNIQVYENHTGLVQSAMVQSQVLNWLSDPNIPLARAQRAGWLATGGNQPPVSDRNAYQNTYTTDAQGRLTGGGLNPNAIVGVSFSGTGMGTATWGSDAASAGIHTPTLTGMIQYKDIGSMDFKIVADDVGSNAIGFPTPVHHLLNDIGSPVVGSFLIDPAQYSGASLTSWVAFQLPLGRVGRRHDQILTGPDGEGKIESSGGIAYEMADLPGGSSPATPISLPMFQLPLPSHVGTAVSVSGAVEAQGNTPGTQSVEVDIRSVGTFFDTTLEALSLPITLPPGIWDGVLMPYAASYPLSVDPVTGYVYGQDGNSGSAHPQVYQRLVERRGIPNPESIPIGI